MSALLTPPVLPTPPFVVEATALTRTFRQGSGTVAAVRGVSLEIAPGEFVVIMGPSGSGKSTLLHLLAGLDAADSGRLVVAGRELSGLADDELTVFRRRHIGVVFQAFNLLPTLTTEENVALPLLLDGCAARATRARVDAALASVGMAGRRTHAPDQLSGGEQQRVAVARALVVEPAVILADEPTGSLDSRTAEGILELLSRAAREHGRTVVMVTHDHEAAAHAGRIIHVVDGRVDHVVDGRVEPVRQGASAPARTRASA